MGIGSIDREKTVPPKTGRRKHVPQRTCVGCRAVNSKRSMVRIVRRPEGIQVDPTGKLAGRGAYLHNQRSCWERGLQGALAHALKAELTEEDRRRLLEYINTLPEEEDILETGNGS